MPSTKHRRQNIYRRQKTLLLVNQPFIDDRRVSSIKDPFTDTVYVSSINGSLTDNTFLLSVNDCFTDNNFSFIGKLVLYRRQETVVDKLVIIYQMTHTVVGKGFKQLPSIKIYCYRSRNWNVSQILFAIRNSVIWIGR